MSQQIKIFDTTLRDGEQSPGCSMNLNEKLKMARQLERLRVDIIEAGFAIASPGDFESVAAVAQTVKDCTVASLSRLVKKDIDASAEALKNAASPRIHTFIATSDLHMRYKLKMKPEDVLSQIDELVAYARNLCPDVEFSAEDASRSVGYATPEEMFDLISYIKNNVPNIDKATISVHNHNDLGLGVATSLASIKAGATQVECTLNGIGERAGNAALEEIVMALKTRRDFFDCTTRIDTTQIYRSCTRLARIIGQDIPNNKAIVGANAFLHESGIHQHGVLAKRETYEIMTPESIGIVKNNIVLGKHSGRHAFEDRLVSLGYQLPEEAIAKLFEKFKVLCDRKKDVSDYDLEALVESTSHTPEHYKLDRFVINSGNTIRATAIVRLQIDGREVEDVAIGDGPIFACYKAIEKMSPLNLKLEDYSIRSVTDGEDALGQVSVKVTCNGKTLTGRGLSTDILESSILAYLHAINKFISLEKQV